MKYWKGYLVAGIVGLCIWALNQFAGTYTQLVDMIYPYVSRIIMDYMAAWSADVVGCLWQTILVFCIILLLGSIVLMILLKWNPIQWCGWVLAVVSVIALVHTCVFGLNRHAGSITEDIRLEVQEYSVGSLERSAAFYRDKANEYAKLVSRNPDGSVKFSDFDKLAADAADGFDALTFDRTYPVFSGSTAPVKQLGWSSLFDGVTGVTIGLTGEACVNPDVPAVGIPYAICHEMCHRMCIHLCDDADFGAFLACTENDSPEFKYSGYLLAFRQCYNALQAIRTQVGQEALRRVVAETDDAVLADMQRYGAFFGEDADAVNEQLCKMLVSWHIQEYALPEQTEEEDIFDPMDETDDRLQDIVNPTGSD